jgi:hypothetical protein
MAWMALSSSL